MAEQVPAPAGQFTIAVEVVPPAGPDPEPQLAALEAIKHLPFQRFSVATNPVARPRMSALALCSLIQQRIAKPATLHVTTRDHNRLSIQGLLWGARALGISSVLAATGDYVALGIAAQTTAVHDVDVYSLVRMARATGLQAGVVLDPRPEANRLDYEVLRLEQKVAAGAQFVITQPVYDETGAQALRAATQHLNVPVILGILPLRTARHAHFLHHKVAGISVPQHVRERMEQAKAPAAEGIAGAREMLQIARQWFAGACIMPAFDRYQDLTAILQV